MACGAFVRSRGCTPWIFRCLVDGKRNQKLYHFFFNNICKGICIIGSHGVEEMQFAFEMGLLDGVN